MSVLHHHHSRVLDVAFACVVPSRQLLVEEAAEDVRALGYSCGGFVQEVPASGVKAEERQQQQQQVHSWFSSPLVGRSLGAP